VVITEDMIERRGEAMSVARSLMEKAAAEGRLMSNAEVGLALGFTLGEAYAMARKGDHFCTLDPVEFSTMTAEERRHHRRMLKRIARRACQCG
jgi:hypothetical protein